ncbi:MAG: helix-turn-helix transcriptional regulator [Acidobacteriota bacterium]
MTVYLEGLKRIQKRENACALNLYGVYYGSMVYTPQPNLTARDVAELLNIKLPTVYKWVREKRLPHYRLGPRTIRFDREEVLCSVSKE